MGQRQGSDEDVIVQVRVRRANLPVLEEGVNLGIDHLTGCAIEMQLVPRSDGIHDLRVVTNMVVMLTAPAPVPERDSGV